MGLRGALVAMALAVVGALAGGLVAGSRSDAPAAFGPPVPLAAASPAVPTDPPVEISPDPDYPALVRGLPTTRVVVGTAPFTLSVPIPDGWVRSDSAAGEWRWFPGPPDDVKYTYFLRVRLIGNDYQSIESALTSRIAALESATAVEDLDVEYRSRDTFVSTYVEGGYKRVSYERFIGTGPADPTAYASIAVIGRESDRDGLSALLEKVTAGARA